MKTTTKQAVPLDAGEGAVRPLYEQANEIMRSQYGGHVVSLLVGVAVLIYVLPAAETDQELLATLLVRIGAVAAMASILVRFNSFKSLLFLDRRTIAEQARLGLHFGVMFGLGLAVRIMLKYKAPDLGLEGALLAGLFGGPITGALAGLLTGLPAILHREFLAVPLFVLIGIAGGLARRLAPAEGDVWHFSPFVDMNIYRWYQQRFGKPRGDWQMMLLFWVVVLQAAYVYLGRAVHSHLFFLDRHGLPVDQRYLFYLDSPNDRVKFAIIMAGIACVAVPIKIWNNTRNELIVEEQRRLLVEARLAALSSQINPHFLFNTLNSISSLIRLDPELARVMIQKLASLLRKVLRRQETFSSLGDELDLIDDYLDIEVVRFGSGKLRIVKQIQPDALPMHVPSMILQPLVENSIKHGLSSTLSGGVISIRATAADGRLRLEVEDNGAGMSEEDVATAASKSIGLSNVQERLRVLYGKDFTFLISSQPGEGTCVRIELPELSRSAVSEEMKGKPEVLGAIRSGA